ncbi:hypothetical protein ACOZ0N_002425 [Cronobacter muytjensii]|uniref:hypothetical protein n=1 Tax=Cronobacter muytjensii TaxID=413501 RepID=UPI000AEB15DE|nr:hypothetical protein [Cronobacter muytjensii]MBF4813037.1 hypothetical protein [Cronobacter muytjensii]
MYKKMKRIAIGAGRIRQGINGDISGVSAAAAKNDVPGSSGLYIFPKLKAPERISGEA